MILHVCVRDVQKLFLLVSFLFKEYKNTFIK